MGMAWARLFYLYGPFEHSRRLVPAAIKALCDDREFPATSGTQIRDYLHVTDAAAGLGALSSHRSSGIFNVCSGQPVTVAQVVATIGELLDRRQLLRLGELPERSGDPAYVCGQNLKLRDETDWRPRFGLRDGLLNTIEWWRTASHR
jgi:nucleoside-diphosphate-sugar epimerase